MLIRNRIEDLVKALSREKSRANDGGRLRHVAAITEMLWRLEALGEAYDNPTFELVADQATRLLGELWEKHPVSLDAGCGDESANDEV